MKKVKEETDKKEVITELPEELPEKGSYVKYVYDKEIHPLLITSLLQNGLTEEQACEKMGITRNVLNFWRRKYPEVVEAVKKGKEPVDQKVVNSLYRSAMGYTYDEVIWEPKTLSSKEIKERLERGDDSPPPLVRKRVIRKHVAPNVIAQIFFLKNRLPGEWKDRTNVNVSGKVEYTVSLPPKPDQLKKVGETIVDPAKSLEFKNPKKSLDFGLPQGDIENITIDEIQEGEIIEEEIKENGE